MSSRTTIRDAIKARLVVGTAPGGPLEGFTVESSRAIPWDDSDPGASFEPFALVFAPNTSSETVSKAIYRSPVALADTTLIRCVFGVVADTDAGLEAAVDAVEAAFETLVLAHQPTIDMMREHPTINDAKSAAYSDGRLCAIYAVDLACPMPSREVA